MRLSRLAASFACALALVACDDAAAPEAAGLPLDQAEPAPAAAAAADPDEASDDGATPMDQRMATIGLLNKRNNVSQDVTLKPGESVEIGPVIIRLSACERTAPWELPQETGAFVQVDIRERGQGEHARVFSGWLLRESPSLNVVEHPVYDVWVKDCTMRWPGEAAAPAPAPAPAPSPSPSPAT
jgi:hypothetical protein